MLFDERIDVILVTEVPASSGPLRGGVGGRAAWAASCWGRSVQGVRPVVPRSSSAFFRCSARRVCWRPFHWTDSSSPSSHSSCSSSRSTGRPKASEVERFVAVPSTSRSETGAIGSATAIHRVVRNYFQHTFGSWGVRGPKREMCDGTAVTNYARPYQAILRRGLCRCSTRRGVAYEVEPTLFLTGIPTLTITYFTRVPDG